MLSQALKSALALLAFYGIAKFCVHQTDGFTVTALSSEQFPSFPTMGSEEEARTALNQPFSYLGCGGQSFAFVSQDGRFVLKLFHNHPNPWVPLKKYHARKQQKLLRAYKGYKIVFERLPQESGICFLHLNKAPFLKQPVQIFDKLRIAHLIDLNRLEFVLQKRAIPLENYLEAHTPEETLAALWDLLSLLAVQGIQDKDPRLYRNVGFLEGKALLIDPGCCEESAPYTPKLPARFSKWLEE